MVTGFLLSFIIFFCRKYSQSWPLKCKPKWHKYGIRIWYAVNEYIHTGWMANSPPQWCDRCCWNTKRRRCWIVLAASKSFFKTMTPILLNTHTQRTDQRRSVPYTEWQSTCMVMLRGCFSVGLVPKQIAVLCVSVCEWPLRGFYWSLWSFTWVGGMKQ